MDWRDNYVELLKNYPHKCGAELGVQKGQNSINLLKILPELELLYCVDSWKISKNKNLFEISVKSYINRVKILHMKSTEASLCVKDGELDFVFIDANHKYEAVKEDIFLWAPKVKSGGIVSGHDYYDYINQAGKGRNYHTKRARIHPVKRAVIEVYPEVNIMEGSIWWVVK